jgi:hypothetical protein
MSLQWIDPRTVVWDDWALFGAQLLTLAALVVYVWKTWEMASATRSAAEANAAAVKEAIDARLEAMAPRILVYFGAEELQSAEVVVENRGQGTAVDLSIQFDPPLKASTPNWNPNRYFETPKPVFPPGYRIKQFLDTWPSYFGAETLRNYAVTLAYKGKENGRSYRDVQILDVLSVEHRSQLSRKSMHDLVNTIEKTTHAIESGFRTMKEDLDLRSATDVYLHEPTRDTMSYARELVGAWDAGMRIEETVHTRFWWDPLLRSMRTSSYLGYQAAVRDGEIALRDAMIGVSALVFVPSYVTDEKWEQSLTSAIENLRSLTNLPERPRIQHPPT